MHRFPGSFRQEANGPLHGGSLKDSLRRIVLSTSTVLLAALISLGVAGCADIITYSQDARAEGLKLYRQQQYADAAGAFRNATKQNPLDYKSYSYLGQSYEQIGQHEQAIHAFRTSLQVQAKDIEGKHDDTFRQGTLNGLASAIAKCDQKDTETDDVQHRAEVNNSPEEWFILGKIFAYRGDPDSAIDAYNRAALTAPENFYIAKEYGLYLEKLGQTQRAELPLRRAYAMNPEDADVGAALRRVGVVPGPALKDQNALAQPILPKGPIPELDINKISGNQPTQSNGAAASAPRD